MSMLVPSKYHLLALNLINLGIQESDQRQGMGMITGKAEPAW